MGDNQINRSTEIFYYYHNNKQLLNMLRDNWGFFEVLKTSDLWRELKKHMYPGMNSSNLDDYKSGDIAVSHGYLSLIHENINLIFTEEAIGIAIINDDFEMVKFLHQHRDQPLDSYHIGLISSCKDTNIPEYITNNVKEIKQEDIISAIHTTTEKGTIEIFRYLFDMLFSTNRLVETFKDIIEYNRLDLLISLHERGIIFPHSVMNDAVKHCRLNMVSYLFTIGYSCTSYEIEVAASNGDLEMVKFFHKNTSNKWCSKIIDNAIWSGNEELIDFLHLNRSERCSVAVLNRAVVWYQLEFIKFFCLFAKRENIIDALTLAKLHKREAIVSRLEEILIDKV